MRKLDKCLVVDDMPTVRFILKGMLVALGCTSVVETSNAPAALDLLSVHVVDLVVLDWRLPDISGIDCLQAIRSSPLTRDTPVIMITGENERGNVEQAVAAGVSGYLLKPFNLPTLRRQIKAALTEDYELP